MKVSTATLAFTVPTGHRTTAELVAMIDGDLDVDLERQVLRFGPNLSRHIPLTSVLTYTLAAAWLICPECKGEFANQQGLEGHRAKKHK